MNIDHLIGAALLAVNFDAQVAKLNCGIALPSFNLNNASGTPQENPSKDNHVQQLAGIAFMGLLEVTTDPDIFKVMREWLIENKLHSNVEGVNKEYSFIENTMVRANDLKRAATTTYKEKAWSYDQTAKQMNLYKSKINSIKTYADLLRLPEHILAVLIEAITTITAPRLYAISKTPPVFTNRDMHLLQLALCANARVPWIFASLGTPLVAETGRCVEGLLLDFQMRYALATKKRTNNIAPETSAPRKLHLTGQGTALSHEVA